ncbi:DUF7526 family protein [Halobacterium wangiae]|uniref:DUF7526 family protein n=1 Tax=Halobacterium wangiae TaxID=2902623 RepID=UPI001E548D78|nr:hypothetical protein [Halobacterium wangiae]
MTETVHAEVVYVVPPDELGDHELTQRMQDLAASRYVLVCRNGGVPSWFERVKSFLLRRPIEAITLVADRSFEEGAELTATVEETEVAGVYDVRRFE